MRVLVVEDDLVSVELLDTSLRAFGYDVTVAENGREAFDLVRTGLYRLVVSDWEMPEMSGLEFCRRIRQRDWSRYIYVILVTSYDGVDNVVEGLTAGADDFLTKPFQPEELRVRLRVGERILSLESRDLIIFSLAKLAESRDRQTGAHLERIREFCRILGEQLARSGEFAGEIDGEYIQLLYQTSPLHDIGKVGIPDHVLLKPGPFNADELQIMKQHTVIGHHTLESAAQAYPEAQFLAMARDIALTHHERYDGKGYPRGLSGEDIPLCGRIAALADVYDALTTPRVYKPAFDHNTARDMIVAGSGTQFDPRIVAAFLAAEDDFIRIRSYFDTQSAEMPAEPSDWEAATTS